MDDATGTGGKEEGQVLRAWSELGWVSRGGVCSSRVGDAKTQKRGGVI